MRLTTSDAGRITIAASLTLYSLGVTVLSALPLFNPLDFDFDNRIEWVEWVLAVAGLFTVLGLIIHALRPRTWGTQYAYLGVVFTGFGAWIALQTLLPFLDVTPYANVAFSLFLFSGIVGGGFAYFFGGGDDPIYGYLSDGFRDE